MKTGVQLYPIAKIFMPGSFLMDIHTYPNPRWSSFFLYQTINLYHFLRNRVRLVICGVYNGVIG